jgi:hypothetical protein
LTTKLYVIITKDPHPGAAKAEGKRAARTLVECHLMQLVLLDVHLADGKESLPDGVDPNMEGEPATPTRLGRPSNSCEET